MLNDIITAIAIGLNAEFGDGYKTYTKNVTQGLEEPCFFVQVVRAALTPRLGSRYHNENAFVIQYFPQTDGDNDELHDVAGRMITALGFVTMLNGDILRGTGINFETIDGVLNFFVHYNHHTIMLSDEEKMEDLDHETGIQGG